MRNFRKQRVCFTGHRPEKLHASEASVIQALGTKIRQAVEDGFCTFITGMARGTDIWAAEIVLQLRESNPGLHLVCAVPYKGFEARWSADWQKRYNDVLQSADIVRYICGDRYSAESFQARNEWMVDRSARVIAAFNGEPGGTLNTIRYAEKTGVPVVKLDFHEAVAEKPRLFFF